MPAQAAAAAPHARSGEGGPGGVSSSWCALYSWRQKEGLFESLLAASSTSPRGSPMKVTTCCTGSMNKQEVALGSAFIQDTITAGW
jgi:hypothetical protein